MTFGCRLMLLIIIAFQSPLYGTMAFAASSLSSIANSSAALAAPTLAISAGPYAYQNCSNDLADSGFPLFAEGPTNTEINSVEDCADWCYIASTPQSGDSYPVFGVQDGSNCFCAEQIPNQGSSEDCNVPCLGNPQEICGGHQAVNVYVLSQYLSTTEPSVAADTALISSSEESVGLSISMSTPFVVSGSTTDATTVESMQSSVESRIAVLPSETSTGDSTNDDLSDYSATEVATSVQGYSSTTNLYTTASSEETDEGPISTPTSDSSPIPLLVDTLAFGTASMNPTEISSSAFPPSMSTSAEIVTSIDSTSDLSETYSSTQNATILSLTVPTSTDAVTIPLATATGDPECGRYYVDDRGDLSRIYCNVTLAAPDISTGPADDFKACISMCVETPDCLAAQFANRTSVGGSGECALKSNPPSTITATADSTMTPAGDGSSVLISGPWPKGGGPGPVVGVTPTLVPSIDSTTITSASTTADSSLAFSSADSDFIEESSTSSGTIDTPGLTTAVPTDTDTTSDGSPDTTSIIDDQSQSSSNDTGNSDNSDSGGTSDGSSAQSVTDSDDSDTTFVMQQTEPSTTETLMDRKVLPQLQRRKNSEILGPGVNLVDQPSTYVAYMMDSPSQPTPDDPTTSTITSGGTTSTMTINGTLALLSSHQKATSTITSTIFMSNCLSNGMGALTTWVTETVMTDCGTSARCAKGSQLQKLRKIPSVPSW